MERIGELFHPSIIPIVGAPAFDHIKSPTTAAEVFRDVKQKLAILQLRSPLSAPLMTDFFVQLIDFIKNEKIQDTIILTSAYGYEKHRVSGSDFGYKTNKDSVPLINVPNFGTTKINGSGFAQKLYQMLAVETGLPVLLLFKYVTEGDNVPDALLILQKLNEVLKVQEFTDEKRVQQPSSWKYLFGSGPPMQIY